MKRLSVCLIVVPFLGFTGPCMGPSPPSSDHNETNDGTPVTPPEQIGLEPADPIEPVTPASETPNPPPAPLPPTPPSPPPPAPKPEPVITEPPLEPFTCQDFPPLPLTELPSEETIRHLTADEITYFWHDLFCGYFPGDDPEGPAGCERLIIARAGIGYDLYHTVVRFNLENLPSATETESVTLELNLLEIEQDFNLSLSVSRLTAEWWKKCPSGSVHWQFVCDDELPITISESGAWDWRTDNENRDWLQLDITELYRGWRNGTFANYGLMISQAGFISKLVFASGSYPDPQLRPRLVNTTKVEKSTLRFPLDGVHDPDKITGYDFGDWWLDRRCDENDDSSPRLRHTGIDFRAAVGDEVYSVQDGTVRYAQTDSTWGGYVVLEHRGQWVSSYIHVIPMVNVGNTVTRGDPIATIAFGNVNFDPHLHFQVWLGSYDSLMARRGRLPEIECNVVGSPYPQSEPRFPEQFIDPKCLDWE